MKKQTTVNWICYQLVKTLLLILCATEFRYFLKNTIKNTSMRHCCTGWHIHSLQRAQPRQYVLSHIHYPGAVKYLIEQQICSNPEIKKAANKCTIYSCFGNICQKLQRRFISSGMNGLEADWQADRMALRDGHCWFCAFYGSYWQREKDIVLASVNVLDCASMVSPSPLRRLTC